jgi:O-antigen/teichoic acid export membrane protein
MKQTSLAASIGKSTIFGIASNGAMVATRLFTVPIVISHLGLDGYGIWAIIMTAAAYMRFGSVGIKSAFQKYVAESTGNGDFERTNRLLSTGSAAMLVLSVVCLIPASIFSSSLARYAGVPRAFLGSTASAISLLAVIMMLSNSGAAFEAIVMGAHRIDLVRKFNILSTVLEAVAIIVLLRRGYGLLSMAVVMACSEVAYLTYCYVQSRRILPAVRLRLCYISRGVAKELITFGGSYQLLSILEVLYGAILPVAVLKFFGANAAGLYALAMRLVSAALLPQEAVLQPLLSGGSMVFASGSAEQMRVLLKKAFKISMILVVLPLAFIAAFGRIVLLAWTGESNSQIGLALCLVCAAGLFKALSLLEVVLYRVSGKSLLDNLRQVLRIVMLLGIGWCGSRLGFYGILAGLAITEMAGMVFMFFALTRSFEGFTAKLLIPDSLRVAAAAVVVIVGGMAVIHLQVPGINSARLLASVRTGATCLLALVMAYPVLVFTGCLSSNETRLILGAFKKKGAEC